jgi:hypothetical protein
LHFSAAEVFRAPQLQPGGFRHDERERIPRHHPPTPREQEPPLLEDVHLPLPRREEQISWGPRLDLFLEAARRPEIEPHGHAGMGAPKLSSQFFGGFLEADGGRDEDLLRVGCRADAHDQAQGKE